MTKAATPLAGAALSPHLQALRVTVPYVVVGVLWILFSDRVVASASVSVADATSLQTLKGWVFVGASGLLVHGLTARRLEAARGRAEAFRALVEQSMAGVFAIRDGRFVFANGRLHEMLERDPGTLFGSRVLDEVAPEDRERMAANLRKHMGREVDEAGYTVRVGGQGREVRTLEVFGVRGEWQGRSAVIGMALDVSERLALREELRRSERMHAFAELTGAVVHDFNNLLTAVLSASELALLEMEEGAKGREHVSVAREAAGRGRTLARQLLRFGRRVGTGEVEVVDARAVVRGMSALLGNVGGARVSVEVDPGPDVLPVRMDASRLEQVLLNLVVNAREAMAERGSTVWVRCRQIAPRGGAEPMVALEVEDDGAGIPPEVRTRIFDPFFTTKPSGTGLGLSTVRRAVREAGGEVELADREGPGTRVRVVLPRSSEEPGRVQATRPLPTTPRPGADHRIVVAEDDDAVRGVICAALRRVGWDVSEAATVDEALAGIDLRQPGVLLVDATLEGGGGRTLVHRLATRGLSPVVIFTSGYGPEELAGLPDDTPFLLKPFSVEELLRTVENATTAGGDGAGEGGGVRSG